jgi:hypothetical protein
MQDVLLATPLLQIGLKIGDDLQREAVQKMFSMTNFIVCKGELVEALCSKPEGRRFQSGCH